jgi:hypothetical protein
VGSAQSEVDALSAEIGQPVVLDDDFLVPLAYSRQWGDIDNVRTQSILARGVSPAVRRAVLSHGIATAVGAVRIDPDADLGMEARVCVPVGGNGRPFAYLWLLDGDETLSEHDLGRARETAARLAVLLRPVGLTRGPEHGSLLTGLRSREAGTREAAIVEAGKRGLLPDAPFVLCLLTSDEYGADAIQVVRAIARRLAPGSAIFGSAPEGAAILVTLTDPVLRTVRADGVAEWMHSVALADIAVGQSDPAALADLHEASRRAEIALRIARAGSPSRHAAWATIGANGLIAQLPATARADIPQRLARFLDDQPILGETLTAFLESAGDVQAASAMLSLHRSGLYHRLRRIEELTGLDLDAGEDRLLAHLAIRFTQIC